MGEDRQLHGVSSQPVQALNDCSICKPQNTQQRGGNALMSEEHA